MFWQEDAETMPRAEIRALQLKKLQHTVKWSYDRVPYYHKIMEESGVTPDQIKSLDDVRRLPFTTKADLRDNYPFGLFAVPKKEIVEIHASSGHNRKADWWAVIPGVTWTFGAIAWHVLPLRRAPHRTIFPRLLLGTGCSLALLDCTMHWRKLAPWLCRFPAAIVKSRLC